jgi:hypothetical protein
VAGRISRFLAHVTKGEGLTAAAAFAAYTNEASRTDWIITVSEHVDDAKSKMSASGCAGYWSAMVKWFTWIHTSPAGVAAFGGRVPTPAESVAITKTLEFWQKRQRVSHKDGKDQSRDKNRPENSKLPPDLLAQLREIMTDTVEPALNKLKAKQTALTEDERQLFFTLLMYTLMMKRPCRRGTYAAW